MAVGILGVAVPVLAMLVSRLGVLLRVLVLADIVEMGRLMMMMGRRMMMSGRLKMMLACGMHVLRHVAVPFWGAVADAKRCY